MLQTYRLPVKNDNGFAVDIEAKDKSEIYAVALGVAYAGNGAVGVLTQKIHQ